MIVVMTGDTCLDDRDEKNEQDNEQENERENEQENEQDEVDRMKQEVYPKSKSGREMVTAERNEFL